MFQDEHPTNVHEKAIIGNFMKKCCGKFYTEYIIYAYGKFQPESIYTQNSKFHASSTLNGLF